MTMCRELCPQRSAERRGRRSLRIHKGAFKTNVGETCGLTRANAVRPYTYTNSFEFDEVETERNNNYD